MESRIKISAWLFAFYFFVALTPMGCSSIKSDNQKLREEITNANAENDKLKKELNSLVAENSKMHVRLAQLNLQISDLEMEIQSMQKDLDAIKFQARGADDRN